MKGDQMKNTHTHISRQDEFALGKFLETVIDRTDDGRCRYKDGWNDARVMTDGPVSGLNYHKIHSYRSSVFGKLAKPDKEPPLPAWLVVMQERMERLEARVKELEQPEIIRRFAINTNNGTRRVE